MTLFAVRDPLGSHMIGPLLTVADVAARLKVSRRLVQRMIADGQLGTVRVRGVRAVRVPEREFGAV